MRLDKGIVQSAAARYQSEHQSLCESRRLAEKEKKGDHLKRSI